MIKLQPPVIRGRWIKSWGIIEYLDINGSWENVKKVLSQGFGVENTSPRMLEQYKEMGLRGHNGWDILLFDGDPIVSSHKGVVTEAGPDLKGGLGIVIWDRENKFKTLYWHNKVNLVKVGDNVEAGDLIAYANSTGFSTGTHLHFGLKLTDENGNTLDWANGYFGAIDPTQYLVDTTMQTLTKEQVTALYISWGLPVDDDTGKNAIDFWAGKELDSLLRVRLADRLEELNKGLQIINKKDE